MILCETDLAHLQDSLPESVHTLIAILGYSATMRLISALGGSTLHARTRERCERSGGVYALLRGVLTESETQTLLHHVGGAPFYVPRCDRALRAARNARFLVDIAKEQKSGRSLRQAMAVLCPRYGFSDRYGWRLLRQQSDSQQLSSPAQAGLFD
ncbi:mor transcription activator family protein [Shigella sonnei]|nr:mor transcription activator family protein [Shigella sonnei]EFX1719059.1 mor transcription activator family protein [Shigella sonnei]EFX2368281.1 mor transcription activator family protein [Shigella sonnei]EFX2591162.1 mor transcription activator family protein [Shigella sonnei]EFY0932144.1 mor transcription activator family protein [Shigella sonnei]